jgi:hypothetical protein
MSRKLVWTMALGLVGLTLILGGYFGLTRWRAQVQRQRDLRNLTEALRLLSIYQSNRARSVPRKSGKSPVGYVRVRVRIGDGSLGSRPARAGGRLPVPGRCARIRDRSLVFGTFRSSHGYPLVEELVLAPRAQAIG